MYKLPLKLDDGQSQGCPVETNYSDNFKVSLQVGSLVWVLREWQICELEMNGARTFRWLVTHAFTTHTKN